MLILSDVLTSTGYAHRGILQTAPLSGGAARDLFEDVVDADWAPDGGSVALVRAPGWRHRLEFPAGKVLYETSGWVSHPRDLAEGRPRRVSRSPAIRRRQRLDRDRRPKRQEDDPVGGLDERAGTGLVPFGRGDLVHCDRRRKQPGAPCGDALGATAHCHAVARRSHAPGHDFRWTRPDQSRQRADRHGRSPRRREDAVPFVARLVPGAVPVGRRGNACVHRGSRRAAAPDTRSISARPTAPRPCAWGRVRVSRSLPTASGCCPRACGSIRRR